MVIDPALHSAGPALELASNQLIGNDFQLITSSCSTPADSVNHGGSAADVLLPRREDLKTANRVSVAILFSSLLLGGCAGVIPGQSSAQLAQAQGSDDEEIASTEIKGDAKGKAKGKPAVSCTSGRMVRSAFYWQGRRTANGERFDPDGLTAAHRTLPFGTRLTVTNPRTGKSVVVRINDRGPFTRGLQLDLSRGAARAIGLTSTGTVCISS